MQHHNQQSGVCSLPSRTRKDWASSMSSFTIFFWLFVYTCLFKTGDCFISALGRGLPCTAVVCGPGQLLTLLPASSLSPCHPFAALFFSGVVCNLQISASLLSSLLFLFCACPGAASRAHPIAICRQAAHHSHDSKVPTTCPRQIPPLQTRGPVQQEKRLTWNLFDVCGL